MNAGGSDRDENSRGFRRARNWLLASCAVLTIALSGILVVVVNGVAGAVTDSDTSDEVVGTVVISVLLAIPAGYAAVRAVRWSRRMRVPQSWVPSGPPETVSGELDLAAQIRRLRVFAWRAGGLTVAFLAFFAGGVVVQTDNDRSAQQLLDHGIRVSGRVFDEKVRSRSTWTLTVTYPAGDTWRTADIILHTYRDFARGQDVTVIYDPADPGRVRTPEDENTSDVRTGLAAVPLVIGLLGFVIAGIGTLGWVRRYRAVRRTGWHSASVLVPERGLIFATYHEGGEIAMKGGRSRRQAKRFAQGVQQQQAWLGGEESAMVILFPGRHGTGAHAVPVRATAPLASSRPPARTRRVSRRKSGRASTRGGR